MFCSRSRRDRNSTAGGGGIGGALGGLMGGFGGAILGGLNIKKKEANVTLSIVNARTTEEEALTEGYARKTDVGFGGGAGGARRSGTAVPATGRSRTASCTDRGAA